MRRQALEPGSGERQDALDLAWIERQGLAAWIVAGPSGGSSAAVLVNASIPTLRDASSPPRELVLSLVDLVMGDREEE